MAHALEPGGWALLLGSWLAITSLVVFCIRRVLRSRPSLNDERGPRRDGPSSPTSHSAEEA